MDTFNSTVLILPGLGNSGERHWQSLWEKEYPEFIRVHQQEWDAPRCRDWINTIEKKIKEQRSENVILAAHSLGCAAVAFWAREFQTKIKGALLVAPSDSEAETYTFPATGFAPIPLDKLPFPSIVAASSNDYYIKLERAKRFAECWGSEFVARRRSRTYQRRLRLRALGRRIGIVKKIRLEKLKDKLIQSSAVIG